MAEGQRAGTGRAVALRVQKENPRSIAPGVPIPRAKFDTLLLSRGATRARLSVGATRRTNSAGEPPPDAMLCLTVLAPTFPTAFPRSPPDRIGQPFSDSYSVSLPRFYLSHRACQARLSGSQRLPSYCSTVFACLAVGSIICLALWAYPGFAGFRGPKVPEKLPYQHLTSRPTNTPPHHKLPTATSSVYR